MKESNLGHQSGCVYVAKESEGVECGIIQCATRHSIWFRSHQEILFSPWPITHFPVQKDLHWNTQTHKNKNKQCEVVISPTNSFASVFSMDIFFSMSYIFIHFIFKFVTSLKKPSNPSHCVWEVLLIGILLSALRHCSMSRQLAV